MFPLKPLARTLANHMLAWVHMPLVGTPAIGVKAVDAQGSRKAFRPSNA
jgi:hypothetical protein